MIDLAAARETFERSQDLTVGIEEEYALVHPDTLELIPRFEVLRDAGANDPVLADSIAGELISSEIEIRSGRGEDAADARAKQQEARRRLFRLADAHGIKLGSTGTHPLSDYREQHIIDTPHYHRVEDGLKYVAWRNNTFAHQVHVGVQGADRAVKVCDRLRPVLPILLAISANSPYVDGRDSGLHSARTQIFTKSFPRCGVPDSIGGWEAWSEYVELLVRTGSIVEFTQLWWSVRPHHDFGTVEVRVCDAQTTAPEADALQELIVACVAQALREIDAGDEPPAYSGKADRGEHVARDPLRAGRPAARPRGRAHRGVPGRRGARPPEGVDGRRRDPARAQRRAAPAAHDRRRRRPVRGVREVRRGGESDL